MQFNRSLEVAFDHAEPLGQFARGDVEEKIGRPLRQAKGPQAVRLDEVLVENGFHGPSILVRAGTGHRQFPSQ